jgi:DNA-binding NtrC family response regulator
MSNMSHAQSILVVDDEKAIRAMLSSLLSQEGYHVDTAINSGEALDLLRTTEYGLILTDIEMPGGNGLDLIRAAGPVSPASVFIVMTAYGTIERAVRAMKMGALDFITKPFEHERLLVAVRNALKCRWLQRENDVLRKTIRQQYHADGIIGSSPAVQEVRRLIGQVANTDSTVLIGGESGTGKELVARALHYQNLTRSAQFVPVNCGAIPENLLESELFGHEKGAFTGAVAARTGRFELAHGGTLFLDEVGELSPALQVKLLRVLQERAFERVGGAKTIHVDVRIIAATNQDLEQAVEERRFREDLFYRLSVIPLTVPPLRARLEDVPLLTQHFLDRFNRDKGAAVTGVTAEALDALMRHRWPGNVRELENLIERLVVLKKSGVIGRDDLPDRLKTPAEPAQGIPAIPFPPEGLNLSAVLDDVESQLILKALDLSNGVKSRAAQLLGLNRTTLVEKMKKKAGP